MKKLCGEVKVALIHGHKWGSLGRALLLKEKRVCWKLEVSSEADDERKRTQERTIDSSEGQSVGRGVGWALVYLTKDIGFRYSRNSGGKIICKCFTDCCNRNNVTETMRGTKWDVGKKNKHTNCVGSRQESKLTTDIVVIKY